MSKHYRPVGSTYVVGRICRRPMRGKFDSLFEIRCLDSQFQSVVEQVSVGCDQRGIENYEALTRSKVNPDWQELVTGDVDDDIELNDEEDLQVVDNYEEYDPGFFVSGEFGRSRSHSKIEPTGEVEAPTDLCEHADGSTTTVLQPSYRHLFEHSAASRLFAYLPLYFWRQVLFETNKYPVKYAIKISTPFTLSELMAFLGIMFYMALNDKGKYHFRFYVVCCSSTWIALNYNLLCNQCDVGERLDGVVGHEEAQSLRDEFDKVSKIRQHVLEVVRPLFGTKRIVNMDNYYTSVQLLQELELKGLYARGTIKSNSKHFPRHTILDDTKCTRGDLRQTISRDFSMSAASWCDGDVVNMVSNADASTITPVTRMVGNRSSEFAAPTCIGEYNQNMPSPQHNLSKPATLAQNNLG